MNHMHNIKKALIIALIASTCCTGRANDQQKDLVPLVVAFVLVGSAMYYHHLQDAALKNQCTRNGNAQDEWQGQCAWGENLTVINNTQGSTTIAGKSCEGIAIKFAGSNIHLCTVTRSAKGYTISTGSTPESASVDILVHVPRNLGDVRCIGKSCNVTNMGNCNTIIMGTK